VANQRESPYVTAKRLRIRARASSSVISPSPSMSRARPISRQLPRPPIGNARKKSSPPGRTLMAPSTRPPAAVASMT
jgi:hypothetical protein